MPLDRVSIGVPMNFARTVLAFILVSAVAAFAGEDDWRTRYGAADHAAMQGDFEKAKPLFAALGAELEAVLEAERAKGADRPDTATAQYWLASVYLHQGRYPEAEALLRSAYDTRARRFGEESEPVAQIIQRLAALGDEEQAFAMLERALAIHEKVHGREHRAVAESLHDIGLNRLTVHRYDDAEAAYKRAIAIMEKLAGAGSVELVEPLNDLGWLYLAADRDNDAIPVYRRALAIVEKSSAPDDDDLADALEHLAYAYRNAKRYEDAEPLYLRALPIREKVHGPNHLLTLSPIGHLKDIYDAQGRTAEAEKMEKRLDDAIGPPPARPPSGLPGQREAARS